MVRSGVSLRVGSATEGSVLESFTYKHLTIAGYTPEEYIELDGDQTAWLLEPVLPRSGSAVLWAPSKEGKSIIAMQFAAALAKGENLFSYTNRAGLVKVLYCQFDNPRSLWRTRAIAQMQAGLLQETRGRLILLDKQSAPYPFNVLSEDHAQALAGFVRRVAPDLVVIDTLRESYRGDENDTDLLQRVLSTFHLICRPAAILYVHHTKKPPSNPDIIVDLIDMGRGSSHIPGAVDTIMGLKAYKAAPDKATGELTKRGLLTVKGRQVEGEIKLAQDQVTYLWKEARSASDPDAAYHDALEAIVHNLDYDTDTQRAEALAAQFGKKIGTIQVAISRYRKSLGT